MGEKISVVSLDNLKSYNTLVQNWVKEKSGKANEADLSEVAFSGSYENLQDKPFYTEEILNDLYSDNLIKGAYASELFNRDLVSLEWNLVFGYKYEIQINDGEAHTLVPYFADAGSDVLTFVGNPKLLPVPSQTADEGSLSVDFAFGGMVSGNSGYYSLITTQPGEYTVKITCTGENTLESIYLGEGPLSGENFNLETFLSEDVHTITVNNEEQTLYSQVFSVEGFGSYPILGNGEVFADYVKAFMGTADSDISFDRNLNSDLSYVLVFVDDNYAILLTSEKEDYSFIIPNCDEFIINSDALQNATSSSTPSMETLTYTFNTSYDVEWFKSIQIIGESQFLEEGNLYKVSLNNNIEYLTAADAEEQDPSFNYKAYNSPNGSKPRLVLFNEDHSLEIYSYCYSSSQYFAELHLSEIFNGQTIDFNIEKVVRRDIHQIEKKYIPESSWSEITEKPEFTDDIETLKLVWGKDAVIPAELCEWYNTSSYPGVLKFKNDIDFSVIGENVILPVEFQAEDEEEPTVVVGFIDYNNSRKNDLSKTTATAIYVPSTYTGSVRFPSTVQQVIFASSSTKDCSEMQDLESIILLDSVKTIQGAYDVNNPRGGFSKNPNLKDIEIPDSVTTIGDIAFSRSGLRTLNIPDSVTGALNCICYMCPDLTSVKVGNSVTEIHMAFFNCGSLKTVVLGLSITTITDYAFSGCSSLTSINIPDTVTSIRNKAFNGCTSLTSIHLPANVVLSSFPVFGNCPLLQITVDENNPNYTAENGILYNKDKTTLVSYPSASGSVVVESGVTRIEKGAFYRSPVVDLEFPDSVTSLGPNIFEENLNGGDNTTLKSIKLGTGITSLDGAELQGLTLETLTMMSTTPVTVNTYYASRTSRSLREIVNIYVPAESVDAYKTANFWSTYADKIQAVTV